MTNIDQAGAAPADEEKRPAQALAERMLAIRNAIGKAADTLEEVHASVHGRSAPQPDRPPSATVAPDFRRFFPAADKLVADMEFDAKRLAAVAEALDKAF